MTWAVVRVNDDGRFRVVRDGMRADAAMSLAGRMRDRQSDEDVGEGWNVHAMGAADVARRQKPLRQVEGPQREEVWLGSVTADYQLVKEKQ